MGLTRYWYRPPALDGESFQGWAADCRRIVESASLPAGFRPKAENGAVPTGKILVRGPDGHGEPVISDRSVALNGDASAGQEHEPFQVEKDAAVRQGRRLDEAGRIFEYCKTNGKPYDAIVDACLLAMQRRFGSLIKVEADSEASRSDAGKKIYAALFGSA